MPVHCVALHQLQDAVDCIVAVEGSIFPREHDESTTLLQPPP